MWVTEQKAGQAHSSQETLHTVSCTRMTSVPGCAEGSLWAFSDSSSGWHSCWTSSHSYWADNLSRTNRRNLLANRDLLLTWNFDWFAAGSCCDCLRSWRQTLLGICCVGQKLVQVWISPVHRVVCLNLAELTERLVFCTAGMAAMSAWMRINLFSSVQSLILNDSHQLLSVLLFSLTYHEQHSLEVKIQITTKYCVSLFKKGP